MYRGSFTYLCNRFFFYAASGVARFFGTAILMTGLLAGSAFAVGGSCPSGANYTSLTNPTGALVTLSSLGITSCYFVAASGSDTNNGTSESTPWLHAPMMPRCSNICATVQNQSGGVPAGTGIIMRGGDTWHLGNSSLTASGCSAGYQGGTWYWNTGAPPEGTSSHPIYIGVDQSWSCTGTWARPILTGDNPLCNSSTVGTGGCTQYNGSSLDQLYYVTSCAYQNGSSGNQIIDASYVPYYIWDNLELTGLCEKNPGQLAHYDDYIDIAGLTGPQWFTNLYIHGWSHLSWADHNGGPGCTASTVCVNVFAFDGGTISGGPLKETFLQVVVDGSDSDPGGGQFCFSGAYDTAYSVILYTSQCIANDLHLFHDNIYGDFYENGHSNMLESNNQAETAGTNAFYNNVLYNLETSGNQTGGYGIALSPPVGTTDYIFNNIWWNVGGLQNALAVSSSNTANVGSIIAFNNTFQVNPSYTDNVFSCTPGSYSGSNTFVNNHYIIEAASPYNLTNCTGSRVPTTVTNLQMNNATAISDGYISSETYVFSPPSGSSPTVGIGTNEGSLNGAYCSALSTAAGSDSTLLDAASACSNDTRYACTYNTNNHTMSCPSRTATTRPASTAWNAGAYQFSGSGGAPPSGPQPPTNLTANVH
jgi:hypothetical protein